MWLALFTLPSRAHGGDPNVVLHEGYDYDSCYIDLHPELTDADFARLGREFSDAAAFLPMAGARDLGAGHIAVGLTLNQTSIDEETPQWNHSFSHPGADHWLGRPVLPALQGRVGLGAGIDAEAMITGDPNSNWGVVGLAARKLLWSEAVQAPVSVSTRASATHLVGARDLALDTLGLEGLVSRDMGPLTPYAGLGVQGAWTRETTDELDHGATASLGPRATVGLELGLGAFRAAAQGTWSSLPSAAVMLGAAI